MADEIKIIILGEDQASNVFGAIGGSLDKLGQATLAVAGGGLVALGAGMASAVQVAGEFEAGMNRFASVAGSSLADAGLSLDDVKNKALELGAVTAFSAAEAQDAMINLAKGGVPVVDIMGAATDATLGLAAAGELDLANAADIVSKQLGVWADTGVAAANVADLMAQAANASTVDVEELALGLSAVGGVAKVSGVSFQDLTQTMALLAPGFSSAADAGTSFKTMLLAMQGKSSAALGVMQDLGIVTTDYAAIADDLGITWDGSGESLARLNEAIYKTVESQAGAQKGTKAWDDAMAAFLGDFQVNAFYDANGAMKDMGSIAEILKTSLAGLSEEQKTAALNTMFGSDAYRAAAFLAEAGAAGFDAMGASMAGAGTAADQAAQRNQGFSFALDSMMGTVETLQIVIGSALLPVLTSLIGFFTENLNGVLAFVQGIASAQFPMVAIADAVNALVPGLGSFLMALIGLTQDWGTFEDFLSQSTPTLQAVGYAFAGLLTAAQPLVDLLGANLMPILVGVAAVLGGAVVVALAGMVAGFVAAAAPILALVAVVAALYAAWSSNFLGIQGIVTSVLGAIVGVISAVGGQIAAFWSANGASILATTSQVWGQLQAIVGGALQIVAAVVSTVFGGIVAFIQANSGTIQAVLSAAWQTISAVITTALNVIQAVIRTVLAAIQGNWAGVWQGLQDIVRSVINGIGPILSGIGGVILGLISLAGKAIADVAAALGRTALSIGTALVNGIRSGIESAWGKLTGWLSAQVATIPEPIRNVLGIHSPSAVIAALVGVPIAQGIAAGFAQALPKVVTNLVNGVAGLMDKVATATEKGAAALAIVSNYQGTAGSGLSGFLAAITDLAIQFNDAATNLGGRVLGTASRFAETIGKVTGVLETAVKGLEALGTFVQPARASISQFIASLYILLAAIANMAAMFAAQSIKAAAVFAEAAGKMLAVVGPAIDALKRLPDLVVPAQSQINLFGDSVYRIINELLNVSALFAGRAVQAGAVFGESAAKLLGVVGPAIEALKKLPDLAAPADAALALFGDALTRTVAALIAVADSFALDAVEAAASFAEGAGKVLAILKNGVDGLNAVRSIAPVPVDAIASFAMAVDQVVSYMAMAADDVGVAAAEAASKFAEGAGKVLAILKNGVDGLLGVRDLGPIGYEAIASFALAVDQVVAYLAMAAEDVGVDALAAAAAFGEGAGKALAFIGNAVDSFTKLADMGRLSVAAVNAFSFNVIVVITQLQQMAQVFSTESLAATAEFAAAVGKTVSGLGAAGDSLAKLADTKRLPIDAVNAWSFNVIVVITQLQQMARVFSAEAMAAALAFASSVAAVAQTIQQGLEVFAELGEFPKTAKTVFAALQSGLTQFLDAMASMTLPAAYDLGQNLVIAIANGIYAQIPALQQAMIAAVNATAAAGGPTFTMLGQLGGSVSGGLPPGGGATTNSSNQSITIEAGAIVAQQQPGQSSEAFAQATVEQLRQQIRMRQ